MNGEKMKTFIKKISLKKFIIYLIILCFKNSVGSTSPIYIHSFATGNAFQQPSGIAVDPVSGKVFVADTISTSNLLNILLTTQGRVYSFNSTGINQNIFFNDSNTTVLNASKISAIATSKRADGSPNMLMMRTQNGINDYKIADHLLSNGATGVFPYSTTYTLPTSIAIGKNADGTTSNIYITTTNPQIRILNVGTSTILPSEGTPISLAPGEIATGLAYNSSYGYLYAALRDQGQVKVIGQNTFYLPTDNIELPSAAITLNMSGAYGLLWVADQFNKNIQCYKYSTDEAKYVLVSQSNSNALNRPVGLALNEKSGQIYALDEDVTKGVQIFFSPDAWVQSGISILQNLPLNQDLVLDSNLTINNVPNPINRQLRVSATDNNGVSIEGTGLLTLTAKLTLQDTLSVPDGLNRLVADQVNLNTNGILSLSGGQLSITNKLGFNGGTLQAHTNYTTSLAPTQVTVDTGGGSVQVDDGITFKIPTSITKAVTAAGSFIKQGLGILRLTSLYEGNMSIENGVVSISASDGNVPLATNPTLTLGTNTGNSATDTAGTLQIHNPNSPTFSNIGIYHPITLNSGGGIFDVAINTLAGPGEISGNGSLTKKGLGVLSIVSNTTYKGGTFLTEGTLQAGTTNALPTPPSAVDPAFPKNGDLNIGSSGIFDLNLYSQTVKRLTGSGIVTSSNYSSSSSSVLTIMSDSESDTESSDITFSGVIQDGSGKVAVVIDSPGGTQIFSGTNTFSGGLTIKRGILAVSSDSNLGAANSALTFGSNTGSNDTAGFLALINSLPMTINRPITLNLGGGKITGTDSNQITLPATISGPGGLSFLGNLNIGLGSTSGGANLYSGGTNFTGTHQVTFYNSGAFSSGPINMQGTITLNWGIGATLVNNITLNGNIGLNTAGFAQAALTGIISGNGGILNIIDNLSLGTVGDAANTYQGLTTLAAGKTVTTYKSNVFGTSSVTMNNGSSLRWGADANFDNNFILSGTVTTNTSGFNGTLGGVISGSGNLIISDNLSLGLGTVGETPNTYSGGTTLAAGKTVTIYKSGALGTGIVTMADNTTLQFGAAATIPNSITLNGTTATINTGGFASTLTGIISQVGTTITKLIVKGGNILTMNAVTSHEGGTEVQGGTTLFAGISNLFGGLNKSLSLMDAGSTFDITSGSQVLGNLNGEAGTIVKLGNNTLTLGTENNSSFAGVIQDNGNIGKIIKQGTGTWSVSGLNTYSGGTAISAGTIQVGNSSALGTGTVSMENGTALAWGANATIANPFTLNGTAAINSSGFSATLSGVLSGQGSLNIIDNLNLGTTGGVANTYSGGTTLAANKTVTVYKSSALGTGTVTMAGSTTLKWGANATIANPFTLNEVAAINSAGFSGTLSGILSGNGGLNIVDNLSLGTVGEAANTYSGGTTLATGKTVSVYKSGALGIGTSTMVNGATLLWGTNATLANPFALNGTSAINSAGFSGALSGILSGNGGLNIVDNLSLGVVGGAANTYSGGTTLAANKTVTVYKSNALGTGTVTMAGGSTLAWGSAATLANPFALNGETTINSSGFSATLSGILSGQGSLNIIDNLNLGTTGGVANTYSGGTTLAANKTVTVYKSSALGTGTVSMSDNTTLQFGASATISNAITVTGNTATLNTAGFASTLTGIISQVGTTLTKLIVKGGNILTMKGIISHTGGTEVQGGTTLKAGIANLFGGTNKSLSLVDSGSAFDMTVGSQVLGDLNGDAGTIINLGSNTLTFGTANDSTFKGVIQGSGGKVVKQGAGTWVVSGANTYTGGTTVSAGTVQVGNSSAFGTGTVTMAGSTTLKWGANLTLANPFIFNGTTTINPAGFTATLSGVLSGQGGLNIVDNLSLGTIGGVANTYSGGTTLAAGKTITIYKSGALGSGSVTMADNTTFAWGSSSTLENEFTFNGATTVNPSTFSATFSGILSGQGGLNIVDNLSLGTPGGSANTYSGGTTLAANKTVTVNKSGALGSGSVTMADGTTLKWGAAATLVNPFTFNGTTTLNPAGFSASLTGVLSGAGGINIVDNLSLGTIGEVPNTYSGGTNISSNKTVTVNKSGALGTGTVTMADNTTLQFGASATIPNAITVTGNTATINTAGFASTLDGAISQALNTITNLIIKGGNILTMNGVASHAGGTEVQGSTTLEAGIANLFGGTNKSLALIGAGSTFNVTAGSQVLGNLNGDAGTLINLGSNTLTFGTANDSTFKGVIQGNGGKVVKQGVGTWVVSGSNTYTGGTTISAGTVQVGNSSAFGTGTITMTGSTTLKWGENLTLANPFALNGETTINPAGFTATLSDVLSGQGGLNIVDNLSLGTVGDVANTYSGGTSISANKTVTVNKSGALGTGIVTMADNTTLQFGASATIPNAIAVTGNTATINTAGFANILGGAISQALNTVTKLIIKGGNILTMNGIASHAGGTEVQGGTSLKAGIANLFGSSNKSLTLVDAGSTFDMAVGSQTLNNLNGEANTIINLEGNTLTLIPVNDSIFNGTIQGNGGKIIKQGSKVLTLGGNNSFSGGLELQGGGLRATSSTALGTGPITLYDQTTLNIQVPLTLIGDNSILFANGLATLQIDSPTTINTKISGNGGFYKTGFSDLTLTYSNSDYEGQTFVQEGTLAVNGDITSNITVSSGAILTGTGSVQTVTNAGTVAPSDPIGTFIIKGDYLPSSQGFTQITVNPSISNKLDVKGTAHLNNSILAVNVTPGDSTAYENHPPFEILSSDNVVNGQFGAIQSSHVRYLWTADYETDPNKVFLNFDRLVLFEEIVRSVSDNTNPISSAHYFDNLPHPITDPDLSNVISIFNSQPEAYGITDIFEEISPDELLLTEETATLVNEINGFRMHYLRDMVSSPATAAAAFTTVKSQRSTALLTQLRQAFGHIRPEDQQVRSPSMSLNMQQHMQDNALMMGPKGGIWIQGFGNISHQKASGIDMGYRNKMAGSLIGIDYKLKPDLFVGASVGYDESRIKWINALSKGRIKDYLASVYGTWFYDKLYVNASFTGAYNRYNIRRRMTFHTSLDRTAHSRHKGYVLAPSLEVGQGFTLLNGIEVVPFIRGDYIHIHENGYEEKGAGSLNLHIRKKTNTALRTEPGLNIYRHFKLEEGLLTAKVKLSYVNKHPLKKGRITANLVGQPGTFLASGTNKTQHQVSPGLSLDYKSNSGFFISAAYDAQLSSKYNAHEVSLKIGTKF